MIVDAVWEVWLSPWLRWVSKLLTSREISIYPSLSTETLEYLLTSYVCADGLCCCVGAQVSASDISDAMASEAAERAKSMGITNANFYTSDLESVTGRYNTVTCVDVAIHYPTDKMAEMVGHLCSLADERVMISFAPKTWYYELLKKIGEFFPGPSKTTRAYLHEESVVRDALKKAGFEVAREEMTGTSFYFSRLLEAKRV